jgi:AcrR family transcriptional regulator
MRYKEYNVNRVLEKSIWLFWQKGFNGSSINDLVSETGVNRFSLYKEFNNKEGILDASLKLYRDRYCDNKLAILEGEGDLVEILLNFYMSFFQDDVPVPGCFFIHIGTELADIDAGIKKSLNDYLNEIQMLFTNLLVNNKYTVADAEFRSRHLLGLFCTTMSLSLIQSDEERNKYVTNGIHIIL